MADNDYFAAADSSEIGARLFERIRQHEECGKSTGRFGRIAKSHAMSVGASTNDTGNVSWAITAGGEQGEVLMSRENHFASLGMGVLNLTTAERPAIQCGAVNGDTDSLGQSLLADGLIDYYLTKRGVETILKRATKKAIFQSEGFVYVPWDPNAGQPYMPTGMDDEGAAIGKTMTGDVAFFCMGPFDVVRDEYANSYEELNWLMVRVWRSRYDLIAQYPELEDEILGIESKDEGRRLGFAKRGADTDLVACWEFFHKRTPSMPHGRQVTLLSDEVVLFDGPIPYADLPVYRVTPDELDDTPFGHTQMFDLMGPQEAVDGIDTSIITCQLGRGTGNMLVPRKANISVDEISTYQNAIMYDGDQRPEPLAFPPTPPELFESKKQKIGAMETLTGISSVTRGNPSESVGADSSGAKLALLDAKSIQNNSGIEKSHVGLYRDVCGAILQRFQDFGGDVERVAQLAGKNNQYLLRHFYAKDLKGVSLTKVEMGNPVLRTTSGKMAVADKAVELGVIKPGQLDKYLMLLRTGQEGPLFELEQSVQMRIRGENEALRDGQRQHAALITDAHWKEIPEHLSLLDDPSVREPTPENQQLQQRVLAAVQQHIDLFLSMPSWMAMIRGGPEAVAIQQQIQASMAPPPMPGQPTQTPPPQPGAQSGTPPPASGAQDVTDPMGSKPDQPGMPRMAVQPGGEPAVNPGMELQ